MNLLAVAVGGAIGSMARYLLTGLVVRASGPAFPLGTFVVNLIGCAAFGALAGAASTRLSLAPEVRLFWFTGILGGFTTFSSYAFESFALIREGQVLAAGANIVGQVVLGLVVLGFAYAVAANH
ncbi:MAG TPA: fluoride efflux transporter CrcB [Vicinamibacterales bacterium]|nr:fluoride efflux transporter CrcB [Vicinamibacterales bacterium]